MKKFRISRKEKKKLKRGFFLYPPDEKGNSTMGFPKRNQEDYTAYKQGVLVDRFKTTKAERKRRSIEFDKTYRVPIEISDKELLKAVNEVFAKEYREKAYKIFKRAKTHQVAIEDYHIFVNAYNLDKTNLCCLSMDSAEDNLMRSKPKKLK